MVAAHSVAGPEFPPLVVDLKLENSGIRDPVLIDEVSGEITAVAWKQGTTDTLSAVPVRDSILAIADASYFDWPVLPEASMGECGRKRRVNSRRDRRARAWNCIGRCMADRRRKWPSSAELETRARAGSGSQQNRERNSTTRRRHGDRLCVTACERSTRRANRRIPTSRERGDSHRPENLCSLRRFVGRTP